MQAGPAGSGPRKARRVASGRRPAAAAWKAAPQRPHETPKSAAVSGRPPELRRGAHRQRLPTEGSNSSGNGAPPAPSPREEVSRDRARRAPSVRHFRLGRWWRH